MDHGKLVVYIFMVLENKNWFKQKIKKKMFKNIDIKFKKKINLI